MTTKIIEYPDGAIRYTASIDGLGTIRVNVIRDGNFWFAEGEDFDYAAQGDSPDDAMENFVFGFEATIEANIAKFGKFDPEKFKWDHAKRGKQVKVPEEIIKCLS